MLARGTHRIFSLPRGRAMTVLSLGLSEEEGKEACLPEPVPGTW